MLLRTHNALKASYHAPIKQSLYLALLSVFPTYCFRLLSNTHPKDTIENQHLI